MAGKVEVLRVPGLPAHAIEKGECYYCGRRLMDIVTDGCGSLEFPAQETVNRLCSVYQFVSRQTA